MILHYTCLFDIILIQGIDSRKAILLIDGPESSNLTFN